MCAEVQNKPLLLFDGDCGLCNRSVQWILLHEKKPHIQFAALQSETGTHYLNKFNFTAIPETLLFIENDICFQKSDAALKICKHLKWPQKALMALYIFPRFLRNWVYDFIAKNRIKWFGKPESCLWMQPAWRDRFV